MKNRFVQGPESCTRRENDTNLTHINSMKILQRIFSRIAFVRVEFAPDGTFRTKVFLWHGGATAPAERTMAKHALAAVIACGHGVVTKPADTQIAARVKADAETFLWSSSSGQFSFVRRERLEELRGELAGEEIVPVAVFCADAAADFRTQADRFAAQVYDTVRWRWLLRPADGSSAAAQILARRLRFPILGAFLLMLTASAFFSPRLMARRQALQMELAARERSASGAASATARQCRLLAEFYAAPDVSRALLCDRIAEAVPGQVVLTALEVEPLTKRFEAGKPLQRREGVVVIRGTALTADDVSAFARQLTTTGGCRAVRLANVEKERDGDLLSFCIETAL